MSKFNKLKAVKNSGVQTAEYEMYQIEIDGQSPVLIVKPATETNKPYFNALLKRSQRSVKRAAAGKMDANLVAENRKEDKGLFPQYVIVGWKNVLDDAGVEVPFTKEDCADFLGSIADWIFDDLRNFCATPTNFSGDLTVVTEEAAKN